MTLPKLTVFKGGIASPVPLVGMVSGSDATDHYGGYLVGESMSPAVAEEIVRRCNSYDALLELIAQLSK